jgi:hypothetical protein
VQGEDYDNVRRIRAGYKLTLLIGWGKADYVPPKGMLDPTIDMRTPPPAQVDKMDAATFFPRFAEILKDNPPNQVDYPTVHRRQRVGIEVGKSFDLNAAPAVVSHAFEHATADAK